MASTNSWCIVALPEEGHPVHKVSSEKSAHMTLLFLGDQREPALAVRIIEALQHTIATAFKHKFSLGVQKRGTLGQDQADVLFFYKDETGRVKDFRSLLLKNDDIKKAYDSTTQFPEWTPHLTLGYPDTPAHPMPDDNHSISWITFDRIALWLEDSDGPEIELGNYGSDLATPEEAYHRDQMIQKGMVAMESTDDFLAHYGVKGMKWGQRKNSSGDSSQQSRSSKVKDALTSDKAKRIAKGTAAAAGAVGVAYVGYTLNKNHNVKMSAIQDSAQMKAAKAHLNIYATHTALNTSMSSMQREMTEYAVRDTFRRDLKPKEAKRFLQDSFEYTALQTNMTRTQRDMLDWLARDTFNNRV